MKSAPLTARVQVRDVSPAIADLRVVIAGRDGSSSASADGFAGGVFVEGPYHRHGRTLPARYPLKSASSDQDSLVFTGRVTDPCCWSPATPMIYRLLVNANVVAEFGMRRLKPHGRHLYLEGNRFVPRGAAADGVEPDDIKRLRNVSAALITPLPIDPELLREASDEGVLVFVDARRVRDPVVILDAAQWPCVGGVILSQSGELQAVLPSELPNTLLVVDYSNAPVPPNIGANGAIVNQNTLENWTRAGVLPRCPIFVCRMADAPLSFEEARTQCDRLQADTIHLGDFAGYFVSGPGSAGGRSASD